MMGVYKEEMINEWGYLKAPLKNVCSAIFPHNRYIASKIEASGEDGECDFCHIQGPVLPLQSVLEMLYDEFERYFEDPAEELPFESGGDWEELEGSGIHKEGSGYILPDNRKIMTTEEALKYAGFQPKSDLLFKEIASCITNNQWVLKDAFAYTDQERMEYNWDEFWRNTINEGLNGIRYEKIRNNHANLLSLLSEKIESNLHSLRTILKKDSSLYRCVNYKDVPNPLKDSNLWAPPTEYATSQRMSKEGQSRFYASFDKETPIHEAVSAGPDKHHCLGTFRLKNDITILDFTQFPKANILNVPDFFAYRYFEKFATAITQSVSDNEKEKYIPTQLMRDIIEERFSRQSILGIKYRSVKGNGTTNVVLFLDNNTCGDYLELVKSKVY